MTAGQPVGESDEAARLAPSAMNEYLFRLLLTHREEVAPDLDTPRRRAAVATWPSWAAFGS